jgi:polyphosphate kinase
MASGELLARIRTRALELIGAQYAVWREDLRPRMAAEHVHIADRTQWSAPQARWLKSYFEREVLPVLSPLGLDPAHPFPRILNKTLNVAVVLRGRDAFGHESHLALVRTPRSLPRIIRVPASVSGTGDHFVFVAELLQAFATLMFPGFEVIGAYQFRVTRNSELMV